MRSAFTRPLKTRSCAWRNWISRRCAWIVATYSTGPRRRRVGCRRHLLWCRHRTASSFATGSCGADLILRTPPVNASRPPPGPRRARQAHRHPGHHPNEGLRSPSGALGSPPFKGVVAIDGCSRLFLWVHWPTARRPGRVRLPSVWPLKSPTPSAHRRTVSWRIVSRFGPEGTVFRVRTAASAFFYGSQPAFVE